jgi:riboflavin biosynthesis pyrimidine reductase
MVAAVDGRAAVNGRSVALGHPADRALLRALRASVDAVLVGTPTLAAERYANLLDDDARAARVAAGRPAHPTMVTVSRRLTLPVEVPLFSEAGVAILAYTESEAAAPAVGADLEVVRCAPGALTLPAVLADLGARGVRSVLCEGGPTLLRALVAAGGLDDLLLTVAPLVVAGDGPSILEGDALAEPVALELREVHRAGEHLFLHYGCVHG